MVISLNKKLIINVIMFFTLVLVVYLVRYQVYGYRTHVSVSLEPLKVQHILTQFDDLISNHMFLSGKSSFYARDFEISPKEISVIYEREDAKYFVDLKYSLEKSIASVAIIRTTKLGGNSIRPEVWRYDLDYFYPIFGEDSGYRVQYYISEDVLWITTNDAVYIANLFDGSYNKLKARPPFLS